MDLADVRLGKAALDFTHPSKRAPVYKQPTGQRDMSLMEAVAYFAGEPWGDHPICASPNIAAFLRDWNDALSDEDRDRLLPASVWVPKLMTSRADGRVEERRAYLALDWLVRVYAPVWCDFVPALVLVAAALRDLPELVDSESAFLAFYLIDAVYPQVKSLPHSTMQRFAENTLYGAKACTKIASEWEIELGRLYGLSVETYKVHHNPQWIASWHFGGLAITTARGTFWKNTWDSEEVPRATTEQLQQSALDLLERMLTCKGVK